MKPWEDRPIEEANLLNPAFCGELLRRAARQYFLTSQQSFPYPLVFLVLPIVLHRHTREAISPHTQQLHVWLQNNQNMRVGFADRAKRLVTITTEALNFLLQLGVVEISDSAKLIIRQNPHPVNNGQGDEEIRDCFKKADLVGRWFARAGSVSNIYTMWGVQP